MDTFEKLRLIRGSNGCRGITKHKKEKTALDKEIEVFYEKQRKAKK